ncbi:MAG: STAS domain-containing protein [Geobacteraceae bacterium]|nr:STAS domain-containing protein [Geobacteraceae bacterium]
MIYMTGSEARLEGDWTLTGVTRNIDALALSLQQLEPECKKIRIDCGRIRGADINGLQLLNVWLQCAKHRGVEPMLVNVPEKLKHTMQALMGPFVTHICPEAAIIPG